MAAGGELQLRQAIQGLKQYIQQLESEQIEKKGQLDCVNKQLEESKRVIADFERRVVKLEGQLSQRDKLLCHDGRPTADNKTEIKMRWSEGERAPCEMCRYCDAVVRGSVVYYRQCTKGKDNIHAYHTTTSKWSLMPHCPIYKGFTLVVTNGALTTIGGFEDDHQLTNKLFSLSGAGEDTLKR